MPIAILDIRSFKERFDPLLARELEAHIARARKFTDDAACHRLLAYAKDLALAGGKRVRPYAAYLMYRTAGGEDESILETVVAFEILHTFALIHDDLIDRGAVRHGLPSMQEFAREFAHGSPEKETRVADGLALLVGDLAFSWSRETFVRVVPGAGAGKLFDDMVYAVMLGQMLDVKMMCEPAPSEAAIMEKTYLKTAGYTFIYPMRIGATLAGSSDEHDVWCQRMGTSLGIAFQVRDDLLDIVGLERATGKRPMQDVAEAQHTIFTAHLKAHGSEDDRKLFEAAFGGGESIPPAEELRALFERSGSIEYGRNLLEAELAKASGLLDELTVHPEAVAAWRALISQMETRTA